VHSSALVDGGAVAIRLQSPSDFGSVAAHFTVGFTGQRHRRSGVAARARGGQHLDRHGSRRARPELGNLHQLLQLPLEDLAKTESGAFGSG